MKGSFRMDLIFANMLGTRARNVALLHLIASFVFTSFAYTFFKPNLLQLYARTRN